MSMLDGRPLADGDQVELTVIEDGCVPEDKIAITLELEEFVTWWKGVRI